MAQQKNLPASSTIPIVPDRHPSSASCYGENQQSNANRKSAELPAAWSRWNPTREQKEFLQRLYFNEGIRNPSTCQVNEIVERLKQFGDVQGKNVFYWFQNFNARIKQRLKTQELQLQCHDRTTLPPFPETSTAAAAPRILSTSVQPLDRNRSHRQTDGAPKMRGSIAPMQHERGNVEAIDYPRKVARVREPMGEETNTPFRRADCLPRDPKRPFSEAVIARLQQDFARNNSIMRISNFNSREASVHPPAGRIIPPTLVLFPLHPEGLGLKRRSHGTPSMT